MRNIALYSVWWNIGYAIFDAIMKSCSLDSMIEFRLFKLSPNNILNDEIEMTAVNINNYFWIEWRSLDFIFN